MEKLPLDWLHPLHACVCVCVRVRACMNSFYDIYNGTILHYPLETQAALAKTTALSEDQKKHWSATLIPELQSSEESDSESEEAAFIVKTIPWRSGRVTSLFESLDKKHTKNASKRSCKMSFTRHSGTVSDRPKPSGLPTWMLKE